MIGTQDGLGVFHPISCQITHTENADSITSLLDSTRAWIKMLYGEEEDFFANIKHVMCDQSLAINASLEQQEALRHIVLHNCWSIT